MADIQIVFMTFGILLGLNLLSLLLMHTTKVGKYFYDNISGSKSYKIFYNFWMVITGITFWLQVLFVRIRFGKVWER